VAFDLNRVSPLVIAGLDPAIYAEKALRRPCRDGFDSMRLWLGSPRNKLLDRSHFPPFRSRRPPTAVAASG
jgi:hypothetical protein